jgi:cohesin complex subunit SA-1/2
VDVSTGLVRKLPLLIHRFGSKPETAAEILRLVQSVKLDKYDELRQLEALETLLEDVGKQFLNHTDSNVFKEVSASLLHAQKFDSLEHVTESKMADLQDEVNGSILNLTTGKVGLLEILLI